MTGKRKHLILLGINLVLIVLVMLVLGIRGAERADEYLLVICDAVSVVGLLETCLGMLLWISSTGAFDMFGYAMRKVAHMFIPGKGNISTETFYDYKVAKEEGREGGRSHKTLLLHGLVLTVLGVILVFAWNLVAG